MLHHDVASPALRRFYELTFDHGETVACYAHAVDADEFLALARVLHPSLTPAGARSLAPASLRDAIPEFPSVGSSVRELRTRVLRSSNLDLASIEVDPEAEALVLKGARNVRGWYHLKRWTRLESLSIIACTLGDDGPDGSFAALRGFDIWPTTARSLVHRATGRDIEIALARGTTDLRWLRDPTKIERLTVSAERVVRLSTLQKAPMTQFSLSAHTLPKSTAETVAHWGRTVRRLHVSCQEPFGPSQLGDLDGLGNLEALLVPAFPEKRSDWLEFATSHPNVGVTFLRPPGRAPKIHQVAIYRGLAIHKLQFGRRSLYEVAGDFSELGIFDRDHGDLEDYLRGRLEWLSPGALSSEADELRCQVDSELAAKRFIDAALTAVEGRRA